MSVVLSEFVRAKDVSGGFLSARIVSITDRVNNSFDGTDKLPTGTTPFSSIPRFFSVET